MWMELKACDVSHVYISVPTLRQEGHCTYFGSGLYMEFNTSNESQAVEFENASDHYVFRPVRIVPFEEARQIYNYDQKIRHGNRMAITNSNHGVPTPSGHKDFWRHNCKTLIRIHTKPRKGLFDPLSTASKDIRIGPSVPKTLGFTKMTKECDQQQMVQRDEDFMTGSSRVAFTFSWTGESIVEVKDAFIDHGLYDRSASRSSSSRGPVPPSEDHQDDMSIEQPEIIHDY